ncbi:hypothetical protein SUGI_0858510 [Cryptomeria japonica]|nr:hypothetical protein SUGI_0858510 [Cryptomeria japonica]
MSGSPPNLEATADDLTLVEFGPDILEAERTHTEHTLICRFHKLWPRLDDLHKWVAKTWQPLLAGELFICPCAKGFFLVVCSSREDRGLLLQKGPWSWDKAYLCLKPWYSDFDPLTESFSKIPVWVRLPNLPLHFWGPSSLSTIGNSIGKFIAIPEKSKLLSNFTFARILVEMDFSKQLPAEIGLKVGSKIRRQQLDYDGVVFRCKLCSATHHPTEGCSKASPSAKRLKSTRQGTWWAEADMSHQSMYADGCDDVVSEPSNCNQQKSSEAITPSGFPASGENEPIPSTTGCVSPHSPSGPAHLLATVKGEESLEPGDS